MGGSFEGQNLALPAGSIKVREVEHQEALDFMLPALESDDIDPADLLRVDASRFWRSDFRDGVNAYSSTLELPDGKFGPARCFLADDGEEPAAHCCFRIGNTKKEPDIVRAFFGQVLTSESKRRRGCGGAVLKAAVEAALQDPVVHSVDALVDVKSDAARRLFEAAGLQPTRGRKVVQGLCLTVWRKERTDRADSEDANAAAATAGAAEQAPDSRGSVGAEGAAAAESVA